MSTVNADEEVTIAGPGYPLLCVSCRLPVMKGSAVIESQHGPYHGPPLNCVEGR